MKYFIDTEFIEGFRKPLKSFFSSFGKSKHFIDLISIGIVAEDGRTFSAISSEYSYNDADDWVKENVIAPLYNSTVHGDYRNRYDETNFQHGFGILNSQIAARVHDFCAVRQPSEDIFPKEKMDTPIEFYGYYSDYDWVLFCSLFGRMIDLPKGYPMYCRDVKQILDERVSCKGLVIDGVQIPDYEIEQKLKVIESLTSYPTNGKEHDALADAFFIKKLLHWLNCHLPYALHTFM